MNDEIDGWNDVSLYVIPYKRHLGKVCMILPPKVFNYQIDTYKNITCYMWDNELISQVESFAYQNICPHSVNNLSFKIKKKIV